MNRDLLALDDLPADVIFRLLARSGELAALWQARAMPPVLAGRRIALIADDGGWRNTTAFDLGIQAMGGMCVHAPVTLAGKEAVADLAGYLDNWFDGIVIRSPRLDRVRALAEAARAPVVNARTRANHPCETLGDLAWLATRGRIEGLRVTVIAPDANIIRSWVEAAAVLPIEVVQIYPDRHIPAAPGFRATTDMGELDGADVLVTDCWPDGADPDVLGAYRVTPSVLDRLADGAVFLPCPPVTRGQEVDDAAMRHPACGVTAAKAFLLHAQNALLEWVFAPQ